jgi:hypothetical protein
MARDPIAHLNILRIMLDALAMQKGSHAVLNLALWADAKMCPTQPILVFTDVCPAFSTGLRFIGNLHPSIADATRQ